LTESALFITRGVYVNIMEEGSTTSTTPVIQQRRVRLRFKDRSEVDLAIKYLIFAFNILIWVRSINCSSFFR